MSNWISYIEVLWWLFTQLLKIVEKETKCTKNSKSIGIICELTSICDRAVKEIFASRLSVYDNIWKLYKIINLLFSLL
jgi:hypothetical protein